MSAFRRRRFLEIGGCCVLMDQIQAIKDIAPNGGWAKTEVITKDGRTLWGDRPYAEVAEEWR